MKKILDIINIEPASQCFTLQADFKIERKNLKRYQESLKFFKGRIHTNFNQIKNISKSVSIMQQNQNKPHKKISQVQYYVFNGTKIFGTMIPFFTKSAEHYQMLHQKVTQMEIRIGKCLSQQKKKYDKNFHQHEKDIKTFATECYPDTASILFIIGLVSPNKITKKQDPTKQNLIVQESQKYASFLHDCLDQMENLKRETIQISNMYYEGARDMWINEIQEMKETLESFEVNQDQINKIADQTGRVLTDRSNKSNDSDRNEENFQV